MKSFEDAKYVITTDKKDFAKKLTPYVIYGGLLINGKNIDVEDVNDIICGYNSPKLSVKDVLDITDIKCAWRYAVKNFDTEIDVDFLCKINSEIFWANIQKRGTLRKIKLPIEGINKPLAEPDALLMKKALRVIQNQEQGITAKAIKLFAYIIRVKPFLKRNTLTAYLVANKYLAENGCKILYVEADKQVDFWKETVKFDGGKINEEQYCRYIYENVTPVDTAMLNMLNVERQNIAE